MFFKKSGMKFKKITFNLDEEANNKLEDIALYYLCDKSTIIKQALKEYFKKHDKKMEKLDKKIDKDNKL